MDRGDGIQNLQKMVQAAKMYYQEGLTQETIAKKLRTSRPAVSLLLAEARKTGWFKSKSRTRRSITRSWRGNFRSGSA